MNGTVTRKAAIEPHQYANTAAVSGRKSKKSQLRLNKHGSSDDSNEEDTHHYAHIAFINDVFLGVNRERKMNINYDGGEMLIYTYPG